MLRQEKVTHDSKNTYQKKFEIVFIEHVDVVLTCIRSSESMTASCRGQIRVPTSRLTH